MTSSSDTDEGIRPDTTVECLGRLRPAFRKDGTITAGTSSQISDGAAAVVVMCKAEAEERVWNGSQRSAHMAWSPARTPRCRSSPPRAIKAACDKDGIAPDRSRPAGDQRGLRRGWPGVHEKLGVDPEKVNVNGGAIAMGHPVGMSGARITLHLALELKRRGGGVGVAALCGGGGQGDALIVHVPRA